MTDSVCKDFTRESRSGLIFGARDWAAPTVSATVLVDSYFSPFVSDCPFASKQCQEQTASLQTALLPEAYQAGHDMSRTGEPYLKSGEPARSDVRCAVMTRQQNRRVLLPFGPTSSCYRVEQWVILRTIGSCSNAR